MASTSSSAARLLIRDGKSVASLLFRGRASANLTENTGPAIRSLLLLNQKLPSQHPVFAEPFPVMKLGFGSYFAHEEAVSVKTGKMEAGQGKRAVNNEDSSFSEEEEETDFDEEEFDDIDMDDDDEDFDDTDEEDDDGDEEEKAVLFKKKK